MPKKWKREDITPEVLWELLHLDEETGKLYWKERGPEWFEDKGRGGITGNMKRWNGKYANKETFIFKDKDGGHKGSILLHGFKKSAVVFAIYNGKFAKGVTCHKNKNKHDYRPCNIIDVTRSVSKLMGRIGESNRFFIGVNYDDRRGIYQCNIKNTISTHPTPIEAARAYDKAAFEKWGEHARLNFPEDYGLAPKQEEMPEDYYADTE